MAFESPMSSSIQGLPMSQTNFSSSTKIDALTDEEQVSTPMKGRRTSKARVKDEGEQQPVRYVEVGDKYDTLDRTLKNILSGMDRIERGQKRPYNAFRAGQSGEDGRSQWRSPQKFQRTNSDTRIPSGSTTGEVICFACRQPGHKAMYCPNKRQDSRENSRDGQRPPMGDRPRGVYRGYGNESQSFGKYQNNRARDERTTPMRVRNIQEEGVPNLN
jgi:hypothetical protein